MFNSSKSCDPCSLSPASDLPARREACDESSFPPTSLQIATLKECASAGEVAEATVRLLQQVAAQHEVLIRSVEERVQQTVLEHLDKMTDAFYKVMTETSCKTIPAGGERLCAPSASPAATTAIASSHVSEGHDDVVSNPPEDLGAAGVQQAVDVTMSETNAAGDAEQQPQAIQEPTTLQRATSQKKELSKQESRTSTLSKRQMSFLDVVQIHGGHCELGIVQAQGIVSSDPSCCGRVAMADPYVKVLLGEQDRRREIFRTNTRMKTLEPVWNAFCKLKLAPEEEEIVIEVWDEDVLSADDLLGRIRVNLSEIQCTQGTCSRCFDIQPEEECPDAAGKVWLTLNLPDSQKRGKEELDKMLYLAGGDASVADEGIQKTPWCCPMLGIFARLQDLVNSNEFDIIFCTTIVFNAICMMVELEYNGRKSQAIIGLDEHASSSPLLESIFKWSNIVFASIFTIELVMRLVAFGYKFMIKPSSWLDLIIVGTSIMEVTGSAVVNLTFLRVVRLSKLARLLRILLMATFCNPLRVLMKSIYTGFGSLFWSFVLLALIEIIAALFMTQVLGGAITDENLDLELRQFIYTYYGTTSRTTLTMFQITMAPGAWVSVGRPLIEQVSPAFAWFFVVYVGGVTFAIIRIITALFLRQTMQVAAADEHMMKTEKMKAQRKYTEAIRDVFMQADTHGAGEISLEQFQKLMVDPQIMGWLSVLELNARNATYIFELVDNGNGRLTLDEFVHGVFRLKGTAQQIDMVLLQRDTSRLHRDTKDMKEMLQRFEKQLNDLSAIVGK